MTDRSEGARDSTNQSRPPGMQRAVQKGRRIVENAVWSATKTRPYHLESRPRMPFRRGAIRGHSTVAPPITRTRPIRADLPACKEPAIGGSTDHGEYRPRCINVRHAAGHSPDAITCGATRTPTEIVYCSYIQIKK